MDKSKDITVDLGFWANEDEYIKEAVIAIENGCDILEKHYMDLLDTKGKALSDLGYSIEITYTLGYNSVDVYSFLNRNISYQKVMGSKKAKQ